MSVRVGSGLSLLFAILVTGGLSLSPCHADDVIDSPMYADPKLPVPPQFRVFPEKAKGLWLRALERPDAETRYRAAAAFALAHERGVKGLELAFAPLRAELERQGQHPAVRLAAARTLITLDDRGAAPGLWKQALAVGGELRDLVEPALARWDHRPARAVWLSRLSDPAAPPPSQVLAIQALAVVREPKAVDRLRELVVSGKTPAVRLEAARALGTLQGEGLEKDAGRLASQTGATGIPARLAAASMLRRHKNEEAIQLLLSLAEDAEPAVVAVAADRLIEIDPRHIVGVVSRLLGSRDAKVRSLGVEVLFRLPGAEHIGLLGERLDDLHPEVRIKARRSLQELAAKKEYHDLVTAAGTKALATQSWRALEQAAILLTRLDHKPAAGRLVELLTFDRPEVFLTAAWGLRNLAVAETLAPVTAFVKAELGRQLSGKLLPGRTIAAAGLVDHQLSQLNQLLGRQKYRPADAVLRQYVRRDDRAMVYEARAAAIWALGLIHEGKPDAALVKALVARLNDITSMPPEDERVRRMSAVTLGRMKAKDTLDTLRKYYPERETSGDRVNNASGWAIEQMTGEKVPPGKPVYRTERDWFLVPDD